MILKVWPAKPCGPPRSFWGLKGQNYFYNSTRRCLSFSLFANPMVGKTAGNDCASNHCTLTTTHWQ